MVSATREVAFPQSVSKQDQPESRSERVCVCRGGGERAVLGNFIVKMKLQLEGRDSQTHSSRLVVLNQDGHTDSHMFPTHPG